MGKSLCKLIEKKALTDHPGAYADLISKPKFVCLKCGRAANHKKSLCDPESLKKIRWAVLNQPQDGEPTEDHEKRYTIHCPCPASLSGLLCRPVLPSSGNQTHSIQAQGSVWQGIWNQRFWPLVTGPHSIWQERQQICGVMDAGN